MGSGGTHDKIGYMLIFLTCFLGFFIAVIGVGNDFFINTAAYRQYITSDLEAGEMFALNYTVTHNVTFPDSVMYDFTSQGANVKLDVSWVVLDPYIGVAHIHSEFYGYYYNYVSMYFETENKIRLSRDDILAHKEGTGNSTMAVFYPTRDDDLTVHFVVTDYDHTRNDLGAAWDDGKLEITIGFGIDDWEAQLTSWDIIGRLLLFQSPEILGLTGDLAFILNLFIALPIWVSLAYIIIRVVLFFVPFV